jgi:hypothetical protein
MEKLMALGVTSQPTHAGNGPARVEAQRSKAAAVERRGSTAAAAPRPAVVLTLFDAALAQVEGLGGQAKNLAALAEARDALPKQDAAKLDFSGLGRSHLTAVWEDKSGLFTEEERNAAMAEQNRRDYEYWKPIVDRAVSSGDMREVYASYLDFYDGLTAEEQQSPQYRGTREQVEALLRTEEARLGPWQAEDRRPMTLLDALVRDFREARDRGDQAADNLAAFFKQAG